MSMHPIIEQNFREAEAILKAFVSDPVMPGRIETAALWMSDAIRSGGKILACGNGGSLCDAAHFAEELTGRFRADRRPLPALAINDPAYMTCVANDYSYDEVYARFVAAMGKKGDVLLTISTSGNSSNVVNAARQAAEQELRVIALTGKKGKLADYCHLEIRTPETPFSDRTQEIHIKVIHTLVQLIEINVL